MRLNAPAWRFYARFYRDQWGPLAGAAVLAAAQSALTWPAALLVRTTFDSILPARDIGRLAGVGGLLLLWTIVMVAVTLAVRHLSLRATKTAIRSMRDQLIDRCVAWPRAWYDAADTRLLHTSIVDDTERVDMASNSLLTQTIPGLLISIALGVVLVYLNVWLGLAVLAVGPICWLIDRRLSAAVKDRVRLFHAAFAQFSKGVRVLLERLDIARVHGVEGREAQRQRDVHEMVRRHGHAVAWTTTAYGQVQNGAVMIASVALLLAGGAGVATGRMTLGALMAFFVVAGMFAQALQTTLASLPVIAAGDESLSAVFGLFAIDARAPYSGTRSIQFEGGMAIERVSFSYGRAPVVQDVSFAIGPHECVALTGPNGSGKSTLLHLLLGLYRPSSGTVLADGVPLDEIALAHLRRQIAVVTQEPEILEGTIWENITYGAPDASYEQVVDAADAALAHEFIAALPSGYQTQAGDRGVMLSGGQRQRIAIARALVRRSPLVIFDEPTNHLDRDTVRQLLRNLESLPCAPAMLVVTHDPALAEWADRTYVLENGQITESHRGVDTRGAAAVRS